MKNQERLQHSVMEDALALMKTASSKLKASPSDTPDEVKAFGNYVASKMKTYSENTRRGVEHAIYDILIKANSGYFENSTSTRVRSPAHHDLQHIPTQHISSPKHAQYLTKSTPSPYSTESLPQQSLQSLSLPSRSHTYNSDLTSPEGSYYLSSPSPLSPSESISQQPSDSLLTQSQSYSLNNSIVNAFTSSNQHSQYSNYSVDQHSQHSNKAHNQLSQHSNKAPFT